MPVFISNITQVAGLPAGLVFGVFVLSSCGGVAGYAVASSRSRQSTGKPNIGRIVILRSLLAFLMLAVLQISTFGVAFAAAILMLMNFAYAIFIVHTLSLSMELIPSGKAGLFNVLIGIGGAFGSFLGPSIAQTFGFFYVFAVAGTIFFSAYVAFKIFT
jgi:hypothetical protein